MADPPAHWRWLRWVFPLVGAIVTVGSFIVYESYLEDWLYDGFAPANNPWQWVLLAAAATVVPVGILLAARIPLRAYLHKAVLLEGVGVLFMLILWVIFSLVILSGAH